MCSFCPNLNQAHWYGGKCCWTFLGKECVGVPQRPLSFATTLNMWDPLTSIQMLLVVF